MSQKFNNGDYVQATGVFIQYLESKEEFRIFAEALDKSKNVMRILTISPKETEIKTFAGPKQMVLTLPTRYLDTMLKPYKGTPVMADNEFDNSGSSNPALEDVPAVVENANIVLNTFLNYKIEMANHAVDTYRFIKELHVDLAVANAPTNEHFFEKGPIEIRLSEKEQKLEDAALDVLLMYFAVQQGNYKELLQDEIGECLQEMKAQEQAKPVPPVVNPETFGMTSALVMSEYIPTDLDADLCDSADYSDPDDEDEDWDEYSGDGPPDGV